VVKDPAGAGKSAIAQTIAEHYKDNWLAASFFFLRNIPILALQIVSF